MFFNVPVNDVIIECCSLLFQHRHDVQNDIGLTQVCRLPSDLKAKIVIEATSNIRYPHLSVQPLVAFMGIIVTSHDKNLLGANLETESGC